MRRYLLVAVLLAAAATVSCSSTLTRVRPYERELFAEDKMTFVPMAAHKSFEEHVFSIREASLGGNASFQGGCGCR